MRFSTKHRKFIERKRLILGVLIFINFLFYSLTVSASTNISCTELKKSVCNSNPKCVFVFEEGGFFKRGKCVNAKDYYLKKLEEDKLIVNKEKKYKKGITGYFSLIIEKITGKSLLKKEELEVGEEEITVRDQRIEKSFNIRSGTKFLAKIVK